MPTQSLALIVPVEFKDVADKVAIALGNADPGAETYCCGLSATGEAPATHYGCHEAAQQSFIDAISSCIAGTGLPGANWAAVGLTEQDVFGMCAQLIVRVAPTSEYSTNFNAALAAHGLQRIPNAE